MRVHPMQIFTQLLPWVMALRKTERNPNSPTLLPVWNFLKLPVPKLASRSATGGTALNSQKGSIHLPLKIVAGRPAILLFTQMRLRETQ